MTTSKYIDNEIKLYNTLSGSKEQFIPVSSPNVGMYVCGPTVYSNVHLGNCRTFISFDMIYRYLNFLGYNVRYVRNITDAGHLTDDGDVDNDRFVKQSRLEKLEPMEIVQKYTIYFHEIMSRFNAKPPTIEPTAIGHIVEQVDMIKTLLDKGLAYEVNGSVYFDVLKYNKTHNYGILSGRNLEELLEGTRDLDGQGEKHDQRDFALWKAASPAHIMRWNSPWGEGFPGWHLECSVMSSKYLGEQFDIHGGGMDLKFPHHECEIAQCVGANDKAPVKYWMHTNMLTLNGQRMSKSTGNTLDPEELFSGSSDLLEKAYSPMVVRFFMMQAHYRSPLDFSSDALNAAEKGYKKLMNALAQLNKVEYKASAENAEESKTILDSCATAYQHMNDDFNTPRTIATLFELVSKINTHSDKSSFGTLSQEAFNLLVETMNGFVVEVLGLQQEEQTDNNTLDGVMQMLINMRNKAKAERNYELSDQIRDQLAELGVKLKDGKEGTSYSVD